jgi:hypothetical protein
LREGEEQDMGTTDTYNSSERTPEGAPVAGATWLAGPAVWFGAAIAGMIVVFSGLAVDGYQHNNGAGEEALISLTNPGHLISGIGLLITSLASLVGLSVSLLKNIATPERAIRRFVPLTAAWVIVAAFGIGSATYLSASGVTVGHSGHDATAAAAGAHDVGNAAADSGEAGVAQTLKDQGIIGGTDADPDKVAGVLNQGASGHPGGKHDYGKHATFTQIRAMNASELAPLFPAGLISDEQMPAFQNEVLTSRAVAEQLNTTEKASAAGFVQTTNDVPFMGEHWLNYNNVRDGVFDPAKPEGLLFSTVDGERKLVGVWHLLIPGIGDVKRDIEPAGFTGDLDLWHAHLGLCIVKLQGASEGETRESCEAKDGAFTADLRWMMHVWVVPEGTENPDGVFAYLNGDLYEKQQATKAAAAGSPSGTTAE